MRTKESHFAFCSGVECSIKNTCARYTLGVKRKQDDSQKDSKAYMRKCTNQKRYIQDVERINENTQNVLRVTKFNKA